MRFLLTACLVLVVTRGDKPRPQTLECQRPGCWVVAPGTDESPTRDLTRLTMRYATGEVFARGGFVRTTTRPFPTPVGSGEVLYPDGKVAATIRTSPNPYYGCRGTGTYYFADGTVFAATRVDDSGACIAQLGDRAKRALSNTREVPFSCRKGSTIAVDGPYWGGLASRKTWGELVTPLTVLCNPPMGGEPEVSWHPNGQLAQIMAPGHHRVWFSNGQLAFEGTRFDDRGFATEGRCWNWSGEITKGPCDRNFTPNPWNVFQFASKSDE